MTNATSHRSYRGLTAVLISLLLVACAGQQNTEARACGIGKTLVCVERVGKVDHCTCKSKDSMKEILDPWKG